MVEMEYKEQVIVENILYEWACGRISARECKKQLKERGYSIDLRRGHADTMELTDGKNLYEVRV